MWITINFNLLLIKILLISIKTFQLIFTLYSQVFSMMND